VLIILSIFQAFGKDVHKEHPTVFTDIFVFLAEYVLYPFLVL
jgi:hypothetical protein